MPTFGSLFSGIGGFDLGLEQAGWTCAWQVEIDAKCRDVLARRWPDVPRYEDVTACDRATLAPVDLICGGFPCPVVSQAARGRNVGPWLWPEFFRIVAELRPRFVLIEQAEGLRYNGRGLGEVLGDLASIGMDAEWRVLRASEFGAPHQRARVWVVAYPNGHGESDRPLNAETPLLPQPPAPDRPWPDPPATLRVDDGLPGRVDRNRQLGNAVAVPVARWIGERLMEAHKCRP